MKSSLSKDTKVKEWVEEFATPPVQTALPPAAADWAAEFQREQRQEPVSAETERWYAPSHPHTHTHTHTCTHNHHA